MQVSSSSAWLARVVFSSVDIILVLSLLALLWSGTSVLRIVINEVVLLVLLLSSTFTKVRLVDSSISNVIIIATLSLLSRLVKAVNCAVSSSKHGVITLLIRQSGKLFLFALLFQASFLFFSLFKCLFFSSSEFGLFNSLLDNNSAIVHLSNVHDDVGQNK